MPVPRWSKIGCGTKSAKGPNGILNRAYCSRSTSCKWPNWSALWASVVRALATSISRVSICSFSCCDSLLLSPSMEVYFASSAHSPKEWHFYGFKKMQYSLRKEKEKGTWIHWLGLAPSSSSVDITKCRILPQSRQPVLGAMDRQVLICNHIQNPIMELIHM